MGFGEVEIGGEGRQRDGRGKEDQSKCQSWFRDEYKWRKWLAFFVSFDLCVGTSMSRRRSSFLNANENFEM